VAAVAAHIQILILHLLRKAVTADRVAAVVLQTAQTQMAPEALEILRL
jgi:hypothetical protein